MPILVLQGARDEATPPASAEALAGRANVTLVRYPSLDHPWRDSVHLNHARDVVDALTQSLSAQAMTR